MNLIDDINSIGLQWYATLTHNPAAPPPPNTPAPAPGTPAALLQSKYAGVAIVIGILLLVGLVIYLLLK